MPLVTLRARVWIVLLVAAGLILGCAWVLRDGYLTVVGTAQRVTSTLQPASDSVADLDFALAEMRTGATAYALTGDRADLTTYVEASTRARNAFRDLSGHLAGDEQLSALLAETRQGTSTTAWSSSSAIRPRLGTLRISVAGSSREIALMMARATAS